VSTGSYDTTAVTGQGAGIGAAAVVIGTSSTGATASIGASASPVSTVAGSKTAGQVSAAAAVTTPVTPAAAAAPATNPVVNLLAGVLSFFGLNTPVAPSNPLGALVWGVFRTVETGFGLVPVAGIPTVGTPITATGELTGTLGFTEPAGLPLTYTVTTNPTQGSVTVDSAGAFTYTPYAAAATQSVDTFTVTASDGLAATSKTVTVPVGPAGGSQLHGIVSLRMVAVTEPVIDISVNGGPSVPVLVDTGSTGLVIGAPYVGLQNLGAPTGSGVSGYIGGLTYSYTTYTTTVNFGNGIVTAPTSVDVVNAASQQAFATYLAPDGVVGVLGIGPNAGGPGPSIVIAALPGELGNGVLLDESQGVLEFGPNPLPARTSVAGAPYASLAVKVGNGPLEPVTADIDSGGVYGTIPSSVIGGSQLSGQLPAGTVISVYTGDGQTLLYSYTTTTTNTPMVVSGGVMNTGYTPFAQQTVYIAYSGSGGSGTTVFDV
jgi:VCBS repeat-containing protein